MHLVARRAAEFGVEVEGQIRFRLDQAVARKDAIVKGIRESIHGALDRRKKAIDFLRGEARFLNEHEIETGDGRLSFEKAILATGARRAVPPIPGLDEVEFLTNQTALDLNDLPASMIIVGGGYVGIEFAQMYRRFGTRVTLLGRNRRLASGEDPELADLLAGYLREEDIQVYTNAPVTSLRKDGHESVASAVVDGEEKEFHAEVVLLAAGRVGNTDRLDLEAAGVATQAKGFVQVDDGLTTSQPNISAIGDVKGGWMFTHVATYDGPIAALNAVKGAGRSVDLRVVPRVIFSDPALAAVGLTETEASEQGYDVAVGSVPVQGARSLAIGDTRGRLKAVVNQADGENSRIPHPGPSRGRPPSRGRGGYARPRPHRTHREVHPRPSHVE